ncbi:ITA7 protein, partial [Sapayoa aenigma]|nr:ITA7 protein [Sapayoa aenigma]
LLVGAPQALALPGQGANRTGGLFACPLTPELSDCWRVPIDEGVDPQRESKENQWLGVSVKSQGAGGKIVTCAHRYEVRHWVRQPLETRDVIGRCFVLSQDLRVRDEMDGGGWKFCEGRPQSHEHFGTCQQGLAAAFSPDRRYVLLGAPGTYNWKGTLRVEQLNQSSLDLLQLDAGPYEAGGEKDQDPSLIPVPANSYFGTGGGPARRSPPGCRGPPRAPVTPQIPEETPIPEDTPPKSQCRGGGGSQGQFGVPGVGGGVTGPCPPRWMDLVVGAPHFFERKEEIGGAVYVYINPGGHWDTATPLRLNGTRGSMFGIALSTAGDLNHDGFEDLAVGAPFDGAGKVFIYHGSALGIVARPAQVRG